MTLKTLEASDSLSLLAFEGSLDMTGAKEIETPFLNVLSAGKQSVIVDFSKVDFLASFGMRLIIEAYKTLALEDRKLVILAPQPGVEKVIEAAGLRNFLFVVGSETEARALIA